MTTRLAKCTMSVIYKQELEGNKRSSEILNSDIYENYKSLAERVNHEQGLPPLHTLPLSSATTLSLSYISKWTRLSQKTFLNSSQMASGLILPGKSEQVLKGSACYELSTILEYPNSLRTVCSQTLKFRPNTTSH